MAKYHDDSVINEKAFVKANTCTLMFLNRSSLLSKNDLLEYHIKLSFLSNDKTTTLTTTSFKLLISTCINI